VHPTIKHKANNKQAVLKISQNISKFIIEIYLNINYPFKAIDASYKFMGLIIVLVTVI